MDWKEWVDWKKRYLIVVILFIVAYILTIPLRDYKFLNSFIDTTQGIPIWAHLIIIIPPIIFLLILLKIIEIIIRKIIKYPKK